LSRVPDGRLTPRQSGRLTVDRNLTSTSTSWVDKIMETLKNERIEFVCVGYVERTYWQH
jgi:hypothetical protein